MKSQERRDAEAVTIVAGLMLFLSVAAVGAVALVILHQFVALKGDPLNVLAWCVLGGGAALAIRYVYGNRDR